MALQRTRRPRIRSLGSPLNARSLGALLGRAGLVGVVELTICAAAMFAQGWNEETVSTALGRLKEPRLDVAVAPPEVYRAVWIPTFSRPTSVRLEQRGGKWKVITTRLTGFGGYGLGHFKHRKSRTVSEHDVAGLKQLIAEMGLFQAPSRAEEALCLDGTIYSYEIVSAGTYRSWIRYCPQVPPYDRYLEFGRALLKLARVSPDDVE